MELSAVSREGLEDVLRALRQEIAHLAPVPEAEDEDRRYDPLDDDEDQDGEGSEREDRA